jgi:CRP/FNR family transcriptional regulator
MTTSSALQITELLQQKFPSFSKELIEDIAENAEIKSVAEGDKVMEIGHYIKIVALLVSGKVKVLREDEEGHELFLYFLDPGDVCAISLVCSGQEKISKVRATALRDSEFVVFPIKFMDEWMHKHKTWYHFVLSTYSFRFEEVLKTVDDIAFHKMDERLLRYLKKSQTAFASDTLTISHQDIAYELNSSREVISRLLKKLEQRGKLKIGRGKIEIISLD